MGDGDPRRDTDAYHALTNLIRDGAFEAGSRLQAAQLAALTGFSRTPIREALQRLAAEGIVELRQNRGARLVELSRADVEEIFDLRALLEPHAAGEAARRATPEEVKKLADILEEMEKPIESIEDFRSFSELNARFHDQILKMGGSKLLREVVEMVGKAPLLNRSRDFRRVDTTRLAREHQEVLDAIRDGNARRAQAAMLVHLEVGRKATLASFPDPDESTDVD